MKHLFVFTAAAFAISILLHAIEKIIGFTFQSAFSGDSLFLKCLYVYLYLCEIGIVFFGSEAIASHFYPEDKPTQS